MLLQHAAMASTANWAGEQSAAKYMLFAAVGLVSSYKGRLKGLLMTFSSQEAFPEDFAGGKPPAEYQTSSSTPLINVFEGLARPRGSNHLKPQQLSAISREMLFMHTFGL